MDKTQDFMTLLNCTEEEAKSVIEYDQKIDKMGTIKEYENDLTPERKKIAKKYRQADRKVGESNSKKEKKSDDVRQEIISVIAEALSKDYGDMAITNKERQIDFETHDRKFRIILSAPRK